MPLFYAADCNDGKHFTSHESDCNKYYQCNSHGKYEERACANGLHWNQEKSVCDWPEAGGCNIEAGNEVAAGQVEVTNPWAPPPVAPVEVEATEVESTPPPTNVVTTDTGNYVVCCKYKLILVIGHF